MSFDGEGERGWVEVSVLVSGCLRLRAGKSLVGVNPRVYVIEDSSS